MLTLSHLYSFHYDLLIYRHSLFQLWWHFSLSIRFYHFPFFLLI